MKWLVLYLALVAATATLGSETPTLNLERHFRALSSVRHPRFEGGESWRSGRGYIKDRMRHYGLDRIEEQVFNTTVGGETYEGINLVGIAEGSNATGPVMLVGADYSTRLIGNHLKDNTGGVACFLEVIHLFFDKVKWNPYFQNYTVLFVAFDLNTKEFQTESDSLGQPGSTFFVQEWLNPYLNNETFPKPFQGAIILDSVTTYNTENETQILRDGFEMAMPDADADIRKRGEKGDFLGFLYTSKEEDNLIRKTFTNLYNKDRKRRRFRLQDMELHLSVDLISAEVMEIFNHQAHYPFWTNLVERALPAFLLFDTDGDRVDPNDDVCVATVCDVDKFLTKDRISFMTHTTNTVFRTLLELQTTMYDISDIPSGSARILSSISLIVPFVTILLAMILKQ